MWIIKAAFQKVLTLGSQTQFWLCYNVLQRGLLQQQWMSELADCKQCQPWPGWCSAVPWLPTKPGAGFPSYQIHLFHKFLEAIKTGQRLIRQLITWRTIVCYNPVLLEEVQLRTLGTAGDIGKSPFLPGLFSFHGNATKPQWIQPDLGMQHFDYSLR